MALNVAPCFQTALSPPALPQPTPARLDSHLFFQTVEALGPHVI